MNTFFIWAIVIAGGAFVLLDAWSQAQELPQQVRFIRFVLWSALLLVCVAAIVYGLVTL